MDMFNDMVDDIRRNLSQESEKKETIEGKVPSEEDKEDVKIQKLTEDETVVAGDRVTSSDGTKKGAVVALAKDDPSIGIVKWDDVEAEMPIPLSNLKKIVEVKQEVKEDFAEEHGLGKADKEAEPEKKPEHEIENTAGVETPKEETPTITKEYVGKSEDTHFYLISKDAATGEREDLQVVDQEGIQKYSAKANNLDMNKVDDFIISAIKDVEIDQIERSIFVKYLLPRIEKEDVAEEPEIEKEEEELKPEKPEEKPEEEKATESKVKVNEALKYEYICILRGVGDSFSIYGVYLSSATEIAGNMTEEEAMDKGKKIADVLGFPFKGNVRKETESKKVNEDTESFEIYFKDLNDDAQKRYLEFANITDENDENLDLSPLAIVDIEMEECRTCGKKMKKEVNEETKSFEIYFKDLNDDAQKRLLGEFETAGEEENWEDSPIAIVDREMEEGKVPAESDKEDTKIKKLIETKITDDEGNEFEVSLVDDGTEDTVIDVNGREFRFSNEFANLWRDEAGNLSDEGSKELALDALANLEDDVYNELVGVGKEQVAAKEEAEEGGVVGEQSIASEMDEEEKEVIVKEEAKTFTCDGCKKELPLAELSVSKGEKNYCSKCKKEVEEKKETTEGKVPDPKDDEDATVKKLTEEENKVGKFYKDDTNLALQKRDERLKAAKAQNEIPYLAEYAILHLQEIAKNGLPDCYKSFDDFLFDFYPDFSWTEKRNEEIIAVLNDPRFDEILPTLKKDWGIDMREELNKAMNESKKTDLLSRLLKLGED